MDTSEQYIKMRLAARPDLLDGVPPGLFPNGEVTWITTFVFVDWLGNFYYSDKEAACQLERQDQLQEMVPKVQESHGEWFCKGVVTLDWDDYCGYSKSDEMEYNYYQTFKTWEQLWLAFVMWELYHKKWEAGEWVEGNSDISLFHVT